MKPNPIPEVFIEDYYWDILINLLEHASQISFECLVMIFTSFFQSEDFPDDRLSESFQALLYHHLVVLDSSDPK